MEENKELLDSENQTEDQGTEEDLENESLEDLDALKEKNKQLFARAKKAEQDAKEAKAKLAELEKATKEKKEETSLSQSDLIALMKADIAEEDIDEVVQAAKVLKLSVKDALKTSVVRTILAERKEERETAQKTQTGTKRAGVHSPSGKEILAKAEASGEIPDSDEDIRKLVAAQFDK